MFVSVQSLSVKSKLILKVPVKQNSKCLKLFLLKSIPELNRSTVQTKQALQSLKAHANDWTAKKWAGFRGLLASHSFLFDKVAEFQLK